MKYLRIVVLLLLFPLSLQGAITATYDPAPVLFFEPSISPLPANRMVARLGTLTIDTGGDPLFDPNLLTVNMSYEFSFTGPMAWSNHWDTGLPLYTEEASFFSLWAVSTVKGKKEANILFHEDNSHPIVNTNGNVNTNPFIVDFYVVSHHELTKYKPGGDYRLTGGTLGNFQIGVANQGSGYQNGGVNIPVNGSPPNSTTPILTPGTNPENPIIYGDPPEQPTALLTIKEQSAISLSQAIGGSTAKVAAAEIHMLNGQAGTQYAVDVVFTNLANTNPFRLVLQNGGSGFPTIPYALRFNNSAVVPGQAIRWQGLTNTPQSKDILVTGVAALAAQQALAGYYEDTIVVTIIPVDTI